MELISVIMPAYNAEKTIGQAVESVLAQSYKNWELIIVDDCSTDGTNAIARQYAAADGRIRVLKNEKNSGASQTRHNAISAAEGVWLAFLDSDDAWTADKLEKQMAFGEKIGANLIFTASAFMNDRGEKLNWVLHVPERIGYRKLLKQNLISNSSALVRKKLFVENEVLGNNMHEDFACWLKILRGGETAYGIDEPMLIYRLSATSKSASKWKAAKMNWNAYRAVGLGVFEAAYYMVWYTLKGLIKYAKIDRS